MYIHLGRDYVLNDRDIIGIFNMETTTITPRGREFLNYAQKNGAVVSLSDELPQSYVLADGACYEACPTEDGFQLLISPCESLTVYTVSGGEAICFQAVLSDANP